MKLRFRGILPAVIMGLCFGTKTHADKPKRTIMKVATVAPNGTPWSELMDRFKRRAKKKTQGSVKTKIYYGGKLGGEKETIRETRDGRIHMWGGSTAAVATLVPELYVIEAPFLFESSEEADFVLDNYARKPVVDLLAKKNLIFYQWAENGWHGLATRSGCIKGVADLKGQRIRSQEASIHLDSLKAMGASPVEMAVPEVLQSLQTGVVDGFSNTPLFSFAASWYQGIKYFTVSNHVYQPAIILYSKKWFDKQSPDMRTFLLSNQKEDEKFGRDGVRMLKDGLLDNFRKANKTVCQMTEAQQGELKKATSKIFSKYRKKYGKRGKALFDAIIAGKKAWAAKKK